MKMTKTNRRLFYILSMNRNSIQRCIVEFGICGYQCSTWLIVGYSFNGRPLRRDNRTDPAIRYLTGLPIRHQSVASICRGQQAYEIGTCASGSSG